MADEINVQSLDIGNASDEQLEGILREIVNAQQLFDTGTSTALALLKAELSREERYLNDMGMELVEETERADKILRDLAKKLNIAA